MIKNFKLYVLFFIVFFNILNACAVCYGAPDDPITKSLNMSILSLLLTIVFVLSCVFYGIITLIKKSNNIKGV